MAPKTSSSNTPKQSSHAENVLAWKELLSSPEASNFVSTLAGQAAVLFGQTKSARITQTTASVIFMCAAFICVGSLAYFKLVPDGTTGTLAGIIIGYFFKKTA